MPSDNYPYANGRIKIIENSLLDDPKLQRLRELPFGQAVRQLGEWGYAAEYPVRDDVDALIDFRMNEIHNIVDEVTPQKQLTDLFWLSLDAVNLKYLVKARLLGQADAGADELEKGVYDIALLRACVEARDYSALAQPLGTLLTEADVSLTGESGPRELSAAVDRAVYAHIFAILKKEHNELCLRYFTAKADFTNILSVLRGRQLGWARDTVADMLVPGGDIPQQALLGLLDGEQTDKAAETVTIGPYAAVIKEALILLPTGGLPAMSQLFGDTLLDMVKNERFDSFGIGPLAYFMLRGIEECRTLRVLFARKRANL